MIVDQAGLETILYEVTFSVDPTMSKEESVGAGSTVALYIVRDGYEEEGEVIVVNELEVDIVLVATDSQGTQVCLASPADFSTDDLEVSYTRLGVTTVVENTITHLE